tara:strand:+ start:146 stop:988 length:843 start_codon:yes stop_codon:yes gene_type:complete
MDNKKTDDLRIYSWLTFIIFFLVIGNDVKSQYQTNQELGFLTGVSYYYGDLNNAHFKNSRVAGGITYRTNFDRRFSFKSSALYSNVYADDASSSDQIKVNRNLHFKSDIIELSGQIEFNFLPYEKGNSLYPWSPFVFTGVSIFNYNPKAEASNGQWYELQPLGTEGQETTLRPYLKKYSLTQFSIPFGGGIKFSVNKNFNIILEYGLRKTFTDYIDDVSTTYAGIPAEFNNVTIELADRSLDGPKQAGEERGVSTNNDWYSFSGITISFTIKNNTKGCDY